MGPFGRLIAALDAEGSAALVTLSMVEGSSPREAGARLVVRPSGGFHGTIGGGALEWQALATAAAALRRGRGPAERRIVPLGPDLGQCCGGRVEWLIETFDERDRAELAPLAASETDGAVAIRAQLDGEGRVARVAAQSHVGTGGASWIEPAGRAIRSVLLFGAGHVGRALALALAPLPFALRWIDSRAEAFPLHTPANAMLVRADDPPAELATAADDALIVVTTHSHPLDLAIVAEALRQERFAYVGLIGSATKRARFLSRMRAAGLSQAALARLVCPIGVPGIAGKEPATIAASVAAQLLLAVSAPAPRGRPVRSSEA